MNLTEVYVDTVGDAEQYTQRCARTRTHITAAAAAALTAASCARSLKQRFPGIKALAAAKADRDYPIVSAASICAKVTRDTCLRDWAFEPALAAAAPPSRKFGCGYPGGACACAARGMP